MRKFYSFLGAFSFAFCLAGTFQTTLAQNSSLGSKEISEYSPKLIKGELLVKFKAGVKPTLEQNGLKSASNVGLQKTLKGIGCSFVKSLSPQSARNGLKSASLVPQVYKISFDSTVSVESAQKALEQLDCVEIVEPNYKVHCVNEVGSISANQLIDQQWNIKATNIEALWKVPVTNTKRPVITILDSGVDIDHPDLKDNIWTNEAEANGLPGVDDDGNGYIDDVHGFDVVYKSGQMVDGLGHGTHCAGIAAGVNNNLGVVGMNPDALIMPVRVLDEAGWGTMAQFVEGVNYAVANGANIISMSLGYYESKLMKECLQNAYKSCFLVASAGNNAIAVSVDGSYPGSFDFVLGVEATKEDGGLASFSNYDDNGPYCSDSANYEVRAPGMDIISTVPDGYGFKSGTSMSCPCVAGIVSRLMMCKEYSDWNTLKQDLIYATSDNLDAYKAYLGMDKDQFLFEMTKANAKVEKIDDDFWFSFQPTFTCIGTPVGTFNYSVAVLKNPYLGFSVVSGSEASCKAMDSGEEQTVSEPFRMRLDFIENALTASLVKSTDSLSVEVKADFGDNVYTKTIHFPIIKWYEKLKLSLADSVTTDTTEKTVPVDSTFIPVGHKIILQGEHSLNETVVVSEADTLIIMPGAVLAFENDGKLKCNGSFVCKGTKEAPIYIQERIIVGTGVGEPQISMVFAQPVDFEYTNIYICNITPWKNVHFKNCRIEPQSNNQIVDLFAQNCVFDYCHITDVRANHFVDNCQFNNCNIVGNKQEKAYAEDIKYFIQPNSIHYCNVYGNTLDSLKHMSIAYYSGVGGKVVMQDPNFLGFDEYLPIAERVFDYNHPGVHLGTGVVDYESNRSKDFISTTPVLAALVINGQETRDADHVYAPLFSSAEIHFNKPMDTTVAIGPKNDWQLNLTNMEWNGNQNFKTDFEVNKYTYFALDTLRDAVNHEEPDLFVSDLTELAAGHLVFGFRGRYNDQGVTFTWRKTDDADAVGYKIYYSTKSDFSTDLKQFTPKVLAIGDTAFMAYFDQERADDYKNYNGYYKLVKVDTAGNETQLYVTIKMEISHLELIDGNIIHDDDYRIEVSCDPITCNLSNVLELYQVLVENGLDYTTCLDVNGDGTVNIADVVNIQKEYESEPYMSSATDAASFSVENDTLFVTSTVDLAGIEVYFHKAEGCGVEILEGLSEMERFFRENPVDSSTGNVLFAYSLNKGKIPAGKQPLLKFNCSNFDITSVVMSDEGGHTLSGVDLVFNDSDEQETEQNYDVHYYTILGTEVDAEVAKKRPGFYIKSLFSNGRCHKSYKVRVTDFK